MQPFPTPHKGPLSTAKSTSSSSGVVFGIVFCIVAALAIIFFLISKCSSSGKRRPQTHSHVWGSPRRARSSASTNLDLGPLRSRIHSTPLRRETKSSATYLSRRSYPVSPQRTLSTPPRTQFLRHTRPPSNDRTPQEAYPQHVRFAPLPSPPAPRTPPLHHPHLHRPSLHSTLPHASSLTPPHVTPPERVTCTPRIRVPSSRGQREDWDDALRHPSNENVDTLPRYSPLASSSFGV
ncbi:hypothetical protein P153DRAFT_387228 [Dothidotthia symphoricarpi CBS 119687]|uniref:Uncharacterized protein n=1 Tax=Dothidotthia symphoricarpi CBS 119687 TaxID=1392245 RepID=A0A6A6A8F7_9PLEO|nr:uncharacterized protein P153DRAFT_387228 [Dothidotthia symphoricarpi CBS 119687]KAF2127485.1 hypothetical protein P153DRAFT_387228 [Dothidotthia symphoricarpi CBS 119687]